MGRESGIILNAICDKCGSGHTETLGFTLPVDAEARAERARCVPCPSCGTVDINRRITIRFGSLWHAPVVAD